MNGNYDKPERIDNDHTISDKTDHEFLFHLQNCLLLALHEQNALNMIQLRYAQKELQKCNGLTRTLHKREGI